MPQLARVPGLPASSCGNTARPPAPDQTRYCFLTESGGEGDGRWKSEPPAGWEAAEEPEPAAGLPRGEVNLNELELPR